MRSHTSALSSAEREATTKSYFVLCEVMPHVASTCANQTSGSAGQKGGSFRLTAATAADPSLSLVVMVFFYGSRHCHQCSTLGNGQKNSEINVHDTHFYSSPGESSRMFWGRCGCCYENPLHLFWHWCSCCYLLVEKPLHIIMPNSKLSIHRYKQQGIKAKATQTTQRCPGQLLLYRKKQLP